MIVAATVLYVHAALSPIFKSRQKGERSKKTNSHPLNLILISLSSLDLKRIVVTQHKKVFKKPIPTIEPIEPDQAYIYVYIYPKICKCVFLIKLVAFIASAAS